MWEQRQSGSLLQVVCLCQVVQASARSMHAQVFGLCRELVLLSVPYCAQVARNEGELQE